MEVEVVLDRVLLLKQMVEMVALVEAEAEVVVVPLEVQVILLL